MRACRSVQLARPVHDSGRVCVSEIVSAASKVYALSVKVAVPEISTLPLTEAPGHAVMTLAVSAAELMQPPRIFHVPTTSPPHGCTCRQLAGPFVAPPPPHPDAKKVRPRLPRAS